MSAIAIIGGGPAGTAAAIALATAGQQTMILERSRETGDAICGGFLSWRTLAQLQALGIERDRLGGQEVGELRLFAGQSVARSALPGRAIGVSRRRLDTLLLDRAAALGVGIERGIKVRAISGETIDCSEAGDHRAERVILASGKHDLPGGRRPMPPRLETDPVLGLRIRMPASPGMAALLDDAIELHLFDRGYAGLVRQEHGSANLCMAVRKSLLAEAGGRPDDLLRQLADHNPHLADRIALADLSAPIDAIAAVPYGYVETRRDLGYLAIGDQAAVIPSLAGEGIGIALASGQAAATAIVMQQGNGDFQRRFAHRARRPVAVADTAWRMAERSRLAWLAVHFARLIPALPEMIARATRIA